MAHTVNGGTTCLKMSEACGLLPCDPIYSEINSLNGKHASRHRDHHQSGAGHRRTRPYDAERGRGRRRRKDRPHRPAPGARRLRPRRPYAHAGRHRHARPHRLAFRPEDGRIHDDEPTTPRRRGGPCAYASRTRARRSTAASPPCSASASEIDKSVRDAIARGVIPGPRILTAYEPIGDNEAHARPDARRRPTSARRRARTSSRSSPRRASATAARPTMPRSR